MHQGNVTIGNVTSTWFSRSDSASNNCNVFNDQTITDKQGVGKHALSVPTRYKHNNPNKLIFVQKNVSIPREIKLLTGEHYIL